MIANTLDSTDKENVGNNAATVERKKGKKKGATAALQDAPTMRSKVFQSLLCLQIVLRMMASGKVMSAEAQEAFALKMYKDLAEDFVSKSNSVLTSDLYTVMSEYHMNEFSLTQMMRSKGIELLTGKTIVARGKEAKKKTESAIADPDIRKELKKNAKLLRPAEPTGDEAEGNDEKAEEPNAASFTYDSGDDGSLFMGRILVLLAKVDKNCTVNLSFEEKGDEDCSTEIEPVKDTDVRAMCIKYFVVKFETESYQDKNSVEHDFLIRYLFPSDVKRKSASELKRECMETAADQRLNVNKKANMKAQLEAKIILLRKEKDTNLVEFGVMNSASNNSMSQTFQALQNAAVFNLSQEEIGELQAKWRTAYAAQDALKENYQQKTADLVAQIKDTEAQLAAAALTALPSTSSVKKVKKEKTPPASAKKLFMPSAAGSMNTPKS